MTIELKITLKIDRKKKSPAKPPKKKRQSCKVCLPLWTKLSMLSKLTTNTSPRVAYSPKSSSRTLSKPSAMSAAAWLLSLTLPSLSNIITYKVLWGNFFSEKSYPPPPQKTPTATTHSEQSFRFLLTFSNICAIIYT